MPTASDDPAAALAEAWYVSLRTFRRDGSAVDTPVWITGLDRSLVLFTDGTSWKVKRIRNDSRCALAVCDVRGKLSSDWVDARARIVDDPQRERRAYEILRAKYGWQMRALDVVSWVGGRISRRVVIEIDRLSRAMSTS